MGTNESHKLHWFRFISIGAILRGTLQVTILSSPLDRITTCRFLYGLLWRQ